MRRTTILAGALLALSLSLSGCLVAAGDDNEPRSQGRLDADAGPAQEVPVKESTPLATAENTVASGVESAKVEVTIDSLEQESDTTITVNFTLTASNPSEGDSDWSAYTVFTENCGYDCVNEFAVSGVYLLDENEQKRYLVYRDSAGDCVCTVFDSEVFPVGRPVTASALFPAPPESTQEMTVVIPGFPPFKNMPIAR